MTYEHARGCEVKRLVVVSHAAGDLRGGDDPWPGRERVRVMSEALDGLAGGGEVPLEAAQRGSSQDKPKRCNRRVRAPGKPDFEGPRQPDWGSSSNGAPAAVALLANCETRSAAERGRVSLAL